MDHFAGLDVSVKETSVCIVHDTGRIAREVKIASEPDALPAALTSPVCFLGLYSRLREVFHNAA
jgi:transposase